MATVCTATSGGNSNSVCASAKPSVGGSGLAYRNYVSCFEDECPICGKTLRWNPKHVPEGEWTCLDDDDFCAVTGKKKIEGSNVYLKRLSGPTPTNQPVGQVASPSSNNMNCTSGTATGIAARLPPTVKTPCQVYQWIRDNVSYSHYWDSHHGENPTAAAKYILDAAPNGKANCDDQALAAVALLNGLGYSARRVHTSCAGMGHYHVIVRVNGADRVFDTTCTGESQIRGCAY